MVAGQVALSLLLLIGAGLFLRSLRNLENIDTGFVRDLGSGVITREIAEKGWRVGVNDRRMRAMSRNHNHVIVQR